MEFELRAQKLVAGGDALGRLDDGRVVFIEGAIPDELVRIEIVQSKKDFAKAVMVEVIEPSQHRQKPPCEYVEQGCGGCSWQHISPAFQHQAKVAMVEESLQRIGKLQGADVRKGIAESGVGARTLMRFTADEHGNLGLREKGSHEVVALKSCYVAHPLINTLLQHSGWEPGCEVAVHCSSTSEDIAIESEGYMPKDLPDNVRVGDRAFIIESIRDAKLRVDVESFFQSSHEGAVALVDAVAMAAGDDYLAGEFGQVIDAYGGVGLFAATLVDTTVPCTLIEWAPASIDDARINLSERNVTICETSVEDWTAQPAGLVIADPARRGLGPDAAQVLADTGADRIVLVSCDVAAGARDIALLREFGYQHVYSEVLDLFPHTPHVEIVTRLQLG